MVELLTVIAIISILAGLLLAALTVAKKRSYEARAKAEVRELIKAWNAYWITYGQWPSGCVSNTAMTDAMIGPLLGEYGGYNKQNIKFLNPRTEVSVEGFKDPWGNFYYVNFEPTKSISGSDYYEAAVYFPLRRRYHYDHL